MPRMFVSSQEIPTLAAAQNKLYPTIPPEVENWLRTDIESDEGGTIAKSKLYEMYEDFCKQRTLRPCPPNTFGKVVRKVYPHVHTRRMGPHGSQVICYGGIRMKDLSSPREERKRKKSSPRGSIEMKRPYSPPSETKQPQPPSPPLTPPYPMQMVALPTPPSSPQQPQQPQPPSPPLTPPYPMQIESTTVTTNFFMHQQWPQPQQTADSCFQFSLNTQQQPQLPQLPQHAPLQHLPPQYSWVLPFPPCDTTETTTTITTDTTIFSVLEPTLPYSQTQQPQPQQPQQQFIKEVTYQDVYNSLMRDVMGDPAWESGVEWEHEEEEGM